MTSLRNTKCLQNYFVLFLVSFFVISCGSSVEVSIVGVNVLDDNPNKLDIRIEQQQSQADPTQSNIVYFNVYFSSPIEANSFSAADIVQDGSSSGIIWDVIHVEENKHYFIFGSGPMSNGTLRPRIPAGKILNSRGVENTESVSDDNTVLYNGAFEVSVEQAVSEVVGTCNFTAPTEPSNTTPIEFKVHFDEVIDSGSFDISDIVQSGSAVVDTWVLTNCGDDQNFKLEAISITGVGVVQPALIAGSVLTSSLNQNNNSTSIDNQVEYKSSDFIWTGVVDNNWNNNGNWQNNIVPGSGDVAVLSDAYCSSCLVNIDTNIDVDGIILDASFSGNLNQLVGNTITVGSSGWTQFSGTFTGGSSRILIDEGELQLRGGNFISTSENLVIQTAGGCGAVNAGFVRTAGNFMHNNSRVVFSGLCNGASAYPEMILSGTVSFYNVRFNNRNSTISTNRIYGFGVNSGDIMVVENDFEFQNYSGNPSYTTFSSGIVHVHGNLIADSSSLVGNGSIIVNGTGVQTFERTSGAGGFSYITVDKSSGSFSARAGTSVLSTRRLSLVNGIFNGPNQVQIYVSGSGEYDVLDVSATVAEDLSNTEVYIYARGGTSAIVTDINLSKNLIVDSLYLSTGRNSSSRPNYHHIEGGFKIITNDLTIGVDTFIGGVASLTKGEVDIRGDVLIDNGGGSSSAVIYNFSGSSDQNIDTSNAGVFLPSVFNVDKSGGAVLQKSNFSLSSTGADLNIQNGTWNMNGYTLTVNDQLNIGDGIGGASSAVLNQGCTVPTAGSTNTNPTDGTIVGSTSNPTIDIADANAIEGSNLTFEVTLSEPMCANPTNIGFVTNDGSATNVDLDYTDNDSTLIVPMGTTSGIITVSSDGDNKVESDETIIVALNSTDQGSLGDNTAVGTIENDDLCPTGFIRVDGNSLYKTQTFCVMQFEAKDNAGTPVSSAANTPWVSISGNDTVTECESMTEGGYTGNFALISNPEWMTIARDIENTVINWSGGAIGSGHISRGHSDDMPSNSLAVIDVLDPYDGTGNDSSESAGSGWEQKRTHTLSNGSQLWDFAGNVWEWTDWNPLDTGFTLGPADEDPIIQEFSINPIGSLLNNEYKPLNDTYGSTNSFGMWNGGAGGAAIRGGTWDSISEAGIFSLFLNNIATDNNVQTGFRCVYREQQVPISNNFIPVNMSMDTESIITLDYGDMNGDLGTSCSVSNLTNVSETTGCSCDVGGVCTVGVTGSLAYIGPASFSFTITDNDGTSTAANVSVTVDP